MRSNASGVRIILSTISGGPAGVSASTSETTARKAPDLPESRPFVATTRKNTPPTNPPETGSIVTKNTLPGTVTVPGQKSPLIDQLLLGNQAFMENEFKDNPERYRELALAQSPGVLWIGCSDSRAAPERITSAPPGELFVTRNVGNIVPTHDWSLSAVVEYSISHLKVQEIVVVGHSDCGAVKALDKDLQDPYIPLWLNDAREAKKRVDARISTPETPEEHKERTHQIELENVRLQVEHLMTYPSVRQAVDEERIEVHGLYYDLKTGSLSRVI